MVRPQSIVRYERLYLSSFALGLLASVLTWSARAGALSMNPLLAGKTWLLWMTLALDIVISLLLWRFTARTPSIVAKWIVTVFAVFAAMGILFSIFQLATARIQLGMPVLLMAAVNILYIAAATLLFRRDAVHWFGEIPVGEEPFA
ncbi:hypothetical protein [uncultured Sphingomonas sp.]|uniref:hypothetical protein n=1 Tax=uncultured Sphingomonas sp. TaxID=158754 RepID=UPI0035C9467D